MPAAKPLENIKTINISIRCILFTNSKPPSFNPLKVYQKREQGGGGNLLLAFHS
jgi:hypothetical protein